MSMEQGEITREQWNWLTGLAKPKDSEEIDRARCLIGKATGVDGGDLGWWSLGWYVGERRVGLGYPILGDLIESLISIGYAKEPVFIGDGVLDPEEVKRWFGGEWEPHRTLYGTHYAESACGERVHQSSLPGEAVEFTFGIGFKEFKAPSIRELAAKVREWYLQQGRGIRLELSNHDPKNDPPGMYVNIKDLRGEGTGPEFDLYAYDMGDEQPLTTKQVAALREWLDTRLAMSPPDSEGGG
jgi:hypothetical protein